MKKRHMLIMLVGCIFLISCSHEIPQFTKQNVALTSGVTFTTKSTADTLKNNTIIVVDPFTGEKAQSCGEVIVTNNENRTAKSSTYNPQQCNNQVVNPNEQLSNALKLQKPIEGKIRKDNGEEVPAVFYVTVTALYFGSHCSTLYSGGAAYTRCVRQESPF